jgi:serine protease 16
MRIATLVAFAALAGCVLAQHDHNLRTRFFNQPVDHFNPFNRRNFDVRYRENTEFFQEGGPIYIYVTVGENYFGVYDDFIVGGLVYEIAEETNGLLIALEHRYFGVSRPTDDTSFDNLQWLNMHQSLADIARFIAHLKENQAGAANSRVILWGRGYGGTLAIWARQKYPHLVDGAWGSSAPLNALTEYPQALVNAYTTVENIGGQECGDTIRGAFEIIDQAFVDGNTSYVQERLRLCYELDTGNFYDLARLDYSIALESYRFIQNARYPEIDEKCMIMTGFNTPDDPPLNALDGFARWYIDDLHPNRDCFDYSNDVVVASYQDPAWDSISTIDGRRQKFWLLCTQLGAFTTANDGTDHPYGRRFDMRFFRQWCADAFDNNV